MMKPVIGCPDRQVLRPGKVQTQKRDHQGPVSAGSIAKAAFALRHAAVAVSMLASSGAALAETRALVVGIDDYVNVAKLRGSVNDAKDIAQALRKRGVTDLTFLPDRDASRDRILGALDQLIARARADDLIIISFAGHGARETWGSVKPKWVRDASHVVYVLAAAEVPVISTARITPAGARERIAGTEMNVRLKQLDAKGTRTIFVADTCFSGGLTRRPYFEGTDVGTQQSRELKPYVFADGQDPLAPEWAALPAVPGQKEMNIASLAFLAAVDDQVPAREVPIPKGSGIARGALSYAFARVIEGQTSTRQPGIITWEDLVSAIKPTVKSYSDNRQIPFFGTWLDRNRVVIDLAKDFGVAVQPVAEEAPNGVPPIREPVQPAGPAPLASAAPSAPVPAQIPQPPAPIAPVQADPDLVRVLVLGGQTITLPESVPGGPRIRPAGGPDDVDLVYDPVKREVYAADSRDLLASGIDARDLTGVAARTLAIRRLQRLAEHRPRSIGLDGGDRHYFAGDRINIDVQPLFAPESGTEYYLLFDINGNGVVQFLYPYLRPGDATRDPETLPKVAPFGGIVVEPPFGTDMLVLVVGARPFPDLIEAIRALHQQPAAVQAVERVQQALRPDMRIGLQPLFTAPRAAARTLAVPPPASPN